MEMAVLYIGLLCFFKHKKEVSCILRGLEVRASLVLSEKEVIFSVSEGKLAMF